MQMTKGTLTIIQIDGARNSRYTIRCTCGHVRQTYKSRWKNYTGKGCQKCWTRKLGYSRATVAKTHPLEYNSWRAMMERCRNPNYRAFHRYGGRGIKICDRWMQFSNFFEDMGERPEGMSLDRIDGDGDYTPENCRWATQLEQTYNSTNPVEITHDGRTQQLSEWAQEFKIPRMVLYKRLWRGWNTERALKTPVKRAR